MSKRPGTVPGRDVYIDKHRTPVGGVPTGENWDDITARYEGEDLERMRALQPDEVRLRKLEKKHDALDKQVTALDKQVAVGFAEVKAQNATLLDFAARADAERERRAAADVAALERRRKYTIALIGALATAAAVVIGALAGGCL